MIVYTLLWFSYVVSLVSPCYLKLPQKCTSAALPNSWAPHTADSTDYYVHVSKLHLVFFIFHIYLTFKLENASQQSYIKQTVIMQDTV